LLLTSSWVFMILLENRLLC